MQKPDDSAMDPNLPRNVLDLYSFNRQSKAQADRRSADLLIPGVLRLDSALHSKRDDSLKKSRFAS
jgi:hypothetical protein